MGWVSGLAIYVIIWWLVLFTMLPWGNQPIDPEDVEKGQASSAPKKPRLLIKMAATTLVSGVVFWFVYQAIVAGLLDFRQP